MGYQIKKINQNISKALRGKGIKGLTIQNLDNPLLKHHLENTNISITDKWVKVPFPEEIFKPLLKKNHYINL